MALLATAFLAGCGGSDDQPTDVVLVTHDSFAISADVKKAFESESGSSSGSSRRRRRRGRHARAPHGRQPARGTCCSASTTTCSRVRSQATSSSRTSRRSSRASTPRSCSTRSIASTPIDRGDVCLNYDKAWYASRGLTPPRNLVELTLPRYRDQLVVENPATSTRGSRSCSPRSRSSVTGGRGTGASCARTASSRSTAGRTRTTRGSPAPPEARGSGRSSSRTRRALPPR